MATIYYPSGSSVLRRNTSGSFYTQEYINVQPDTIIVLSGSTNFTASTFGSSSYAISASYALNGGSGGTSLSTGSTYPITSSWADNTLSASHLRLTSPDGTIWEMSIDNDGITTMTPLA